MALQQAQMLLSMNSLESLNAGVQQNNTESFAVALCHLAELHAEQVGWLCVCVLCCYGIMAEESSLEGSPRSMICTEVCAPVGPAWPYLQGGVWGPDECFWGSAISFL